MPLVKRTNPVSLPLLPPPYVFNPTGTFDGDDGKWSTFSINIGDSDGSGGGQTFKILPWTSSPVTLVPAEAEWCDAGCAKNRGVEPFQAKQPRGLVQSQSYKYFGIYNVPLPYWWTNDLTSNTSSSLNGTWAQDYLGLGDSSNSSPVLRNQQYIVSYSFQDFFLGSLGLVAGNVGPPNAAEPNFLDAFYDLGQIPSVSYGYTAGAYYQNSGKGIPGNLVLGGYDKSRLTAEGTSIAMPSVQNNSLVVGVQSITYSPNPNVAVETTSFTAASGGFMATIDSALPFLILPDNICDQFQQSFQLQFDNDRRLYTVNSSAHARNLQLNATVAFKIGKDTRDSSNFATIQLPYAAFDQQVSFPIASNATQYFPISKSHDGAYVLGRTFLQEAYVIVDYERANFTIAPAKFTEPMANANVVSIYNTTYTGIPHHQNSRSGLSAGAIAGIVIGIVLAFILIGLGAFVWWRKRHNTKKIDVTPYEPPPQIDTIQAGDEYKTRHVSELTGTEVRRSPKPSTGEFYPVDRKPIPPISEMSPDSTPAELYSPPQESASDRDSHDYFGAGAMRRRGASRGRNSASGNTPGTPIAELPGDSVENLASNRRLDSVSPVSAATHGRGQSDTSLSTNIDEVLGGRQEPEPTEQSAEAAASERLATARADAEPADLEQQTLERKPSHARGLSDTTIKSDTTAVSQPSADELEQWARNPDLGPDRPMSPPVVVPTGKEENTK